MNGTVREAQGVMTTVACPHGHFKCADDQWLAIIAAIVGGSFLSLVFNGLLMKWLYRAPGDAR